MNASPSFSLVLSSPVVGEYLAARRQGIKSALAFDPSGRPGAAAVREDQARLRGRVARYEKKAAIRLPSKPVLPVASKGDRWNLNRKEWCEHRHNIRQARIDAFLAGIADRKADIEAGSPRELFGLAMGANLPSNIIRLGDGWFARQEEDVDRDWDVYSKAWHRAHGPKVTVTNRRVSFRRINPETGEKEIKTAHMDSWRGDWLAQAIIKADLQPDNPNAPLAVRLHAAYDAELIKTSHGYRIYRRTLVGKFVDWVIIAPLGTTYHATNKKDLLPGVHAKIRASKARLEGWMIDWAKCRKLGFCEDGIRSFCGIFDIDPRGQYLPEEIERLVRANPTAAAPYLPELRTLAQAVGFVVPESAA